MSDFRHSTLKPAGWLEEFGPDIGIVRSDMVRCVHCQRQWQVNPHSTQGRGYCARCNGPICGKQCMECVPWEKQLELMEGTTTPTKVVVAQSIPKVHVKASKWGARG